MPERPHSLAAPVVTRARWPRRDSRVPTSTTQRSTPSGSGAAHARAHCRRSVRSGRPQQRCRLYQLTTERIKRQLLHAPNVITQSGNPQRHRRTQQRSARSRLLGRRGPGSRSSPWRSCSGSACERPPAAGCRLGGVAGPQRRRLVGGHRLRRHHRRPCPAHLGGARGGRSSEGRPWRRDDAASRRRRTMDALSLEGREFRITAGASAGRRR